MKVSYRHAVSKKDGAIRIPVIDVRDGAKERATANRMVKSSNGNQSKFIPAKWGYGVKGPIKY